MSIAYLVVPTDSRIVVRSLNTGRLVRRRFTRGGYRCQVTRSFRNLSEVSAWMERRKALYYVISPKPAA